jgi:hypothetical protein
MLLVSCQLSVVSRKFGLRTTDYGPRTDSARRGLSLTEVLISMGILTLGLLGVASVFPVGSYYMQKAEVSDKGSAIAQSVFSEIMARGMLNPRAWYVMIPMPTTGVYGFWNTTLPSDGKYSPSGTSKAGTFTRPFGQALAEAINQPTAATDKAVLAKQFGSAYVIDPIGVSLMALRNGGAPATSSSWAHGPAALFPATAYLEGGYYTKLSPAAAAWAPWSGTTTPFLWPIRRVTFRQPSNGWQMDPTVAEHYARSSDDLTVDFPARDDRPGMQNWDTNVSKAGDTVPLARKWTGDYSWIATVAPPTNAARDGMATNPEGFAYDVSVVVFYKRLLPDTADVTFPLYTDQTRYQAAMGTGERAVKASVVSTGLNGGELLLSDWGDAKDANGKAMSAFDQLKSGQWIMLCGPHPNSSTSEPRLVLKWYQVVSIEPATSAAGWYYDSTMDQRIVTVRGPEWPWQPSTVAANVSNDLCVAICKGAVAVHTKSIRLEAGINEATFNNAAGAGGTTTGSTGTTQFPWQP